jgi:CO/xanthine dehydrogenase Mo-binding subunit
MASRVRSVGRNVRRKDGEEKVTGAALYADDLTFSGMLYGSTIRSTVPCGRIASIDFRFDTSGFVVADARDIPGRNAIVLITDDQPALAEREVRHVAEPILLLAHESRDALLEARVEVEYVHGEPVFDPLASAKVFKRIHVEKGDVSRGFAAAHAVVEGEYRTGHQEQLYIETNGVIAVPENGGITVHGSLQCPYYVHKALMRLLDLPAEKVRVVQTETGGGFGGKEEYPSILAGHAALLALKSGRPVKMIYDRVEDMVATTKRHPAIIRHRTGVTRDGRLTALEIEVVMDGGAYVTLSPVVLSRGVIHAAGPYRCDHVRIDGRVVMTNTPPNGAFRGFGAPQTQFAMEAHMDVVAAHLGLDPVTVRERNALRPGDTTATGQEMGRDCSALRVLREAVKRTNFRRKHARLGASRRSGSGARRAGPDSATSRRGIGLSLFLHGAGFTGAGEVMLASRASLELTPRGARILVANTEIGQGTRTMLAQIVADTLRLPYEAIEVSAADTARVPDSGPTVASRTCMVVGGLLQRCAQEMRLRLGRLSPREYLRRHGPLVVTKHYERPPGVSWDDEAYRGHAYATYAWGCDVVELEVDEVTGEVRPLHVTAVQEIGKAIHPRLAAGQIEGGTVQGLGYALLEEVVMRDGAMANGQLTNYIIPTILDSPRMDVVMLENPYPHGPFGAKGVGELPMDGPAPAVVNALRNAGVPVTSIPATPERVLGAWRR